MICLIREISVQLKYIRECFFSNTNRTNLTNLVGCDPVYIRGIREIRGQLNIIHTRICFFEHESHESDESCKCVALALLRTIYMQDNNISQDNLNISAAASGHACKSA